MSHDSLNLNQFIILSDNSYALYIFPRYSCISNSVADFGRTANIVQHLYQHVRTICISSFYSQIGKRGGGLAPYILGPHLKLAETEQIAI